MQTELHPPPSADLDSALLYGSTKVTIGANEKNVTIENVVKMATHTNSSNIKGSVDLKISIPSGYTLSAKCTSGHTGETLTCTKTSDIYSVTSELSTGSHNVTFSILKTVDSLVSTVFAWSETINVLPGIITSKWDTNSIGTVEDSGKTRKISEVTISSTYYVRGTTESGQTSWFADITDNSGDDTNGTGSVVSPFATIQKAVDTIKATTTAVADSFTIYVDGTVTATGGSGLVMELKNLSSPVNIKIVGLGSEMAVLSAGRARTDVIEIKDNGSNKIALTLENLKLTGVGTSANPAPEGGAIFAEKYTDITLKNCEVSENYCQWGGALRFGHHCNITIDGGEYKDNHATSNGGVINANGTNLDIAGAGDELSITIKGGAKFSNNTSDADGGAFYFTNCKDGPTCIIEATEFTNNTANSGDSIYIDSGNITLSGSVKIDENNDVYLASGTFITITGDLTGTAPVATITPASYDSNPIVLKAATAALIADNIDKFALPSTATNYAIAQDDINTTNAVIVDNTPRETVYLDAAGGKDINDGSTKAKAVKTLTRATGILDYTAATPKIIVVSAYRLASTETSLLDFSTKVTLPKVVTIERYYSSNTSGNYCSGNLLTIPSGTVEIKNVTLDGNWKAGGGTGSEQLANAGGALLYVNGATVTLCAGCTIKNNSLSGNGGGVCNYGTFKMSGGTISGNTTTANGGGVCNYGTFTMSGGTISGNTATQYGGGIYNNTSGVLTINSGTIGDASATTVASSSSYSNKATERGGGIYNNGGTITLVGGNIYYNYAGYGAGIYNSSATGSKLIMGSSCTTAIKYNRCATSGGGIYNAGSGTVTMSGGTISGNSATYGGGVCNYGTFKMSGGEISGNTTTANGGGVYNNGTFTMDGGAISGNSATYGGGIYNAGSGTVTMSGGTISGNTTTANGGAIYNNGTLNFSGAAAVDSNNDVYLESGKFITITGDLTGTAPVATITPKTYAVNTVVLKAATAALITANYNKFALSDTSTYEICPDSATPTQAILIMPQAGGGVGLLGSDFVFTPKINGAAVSAGTTLGDGDTLTFSVAPDSISGVTFTKYKISVLNGSAEIPALTASGSSLTDASVTITAQQAQKFAQVGAVVNVHMEITVNVNGNDYVFDRTIKGFTFN